MSKPVQSRKSGAGSYIFNACSPQAQDRYLRDIDISKPKEMWIKLKEKLQGNDEESRSKLITKFMAMKKLPRSSVDHQFTNKLKFNNYSMVQKQMRIDTLLRPVELGLRISSASSLMTSWVISISVLCK